MKNFQELVEMIRKTKSGYKVLDSKGKKVLGTHKSKKKALKQLAAIEISKKRRA
jgi:hypothetical protein